MNGLIQPYPNDQLHLYRSEKHNLIENIRKAINGEFSAVICYEKLLMMAPSENERNQIAEIRQDEQNHLNAFRNIYRTITDREPEPKMTEKCPDTYVEGLEAAFKDEQETVDVYLDIADQADDVLIKETFKRAAADEQNHAVWFLRYLMTTGKPESPDRQPPANYGAIGALNASTLTLPQMLIYGIQDEYLAHSTYRAVIQKFGNVRPFSRIQEAEIRHANALLRLFQNYQIPVPPDDSVRYVVVPETFREALQQGIEIEVNNISMYDRFLTYHLPQDVRNVFTNLRNGSTRHLAAFRRVLERMQQQNREKDTKDE
ncbi:rubrerythrin [Melghiribacillus thermohalophilus]|uniref:Rubrerythrin n=1 Tax=Melghiribacillus thermohalophilus TaxID=1324956 RepID=A0A4R3N5F6_9BACI|nr:ferritin family protein [Melghiribacillus thermohalophilus]TCT23306.1 rubrerythrin [Melghiribacillus thermohalophilus]